MRGVGMSAPHHKRRRGRPSVPETMNILAADIEDVAEAIKLRMVSRGGNWDVHVEPDGSVRMENHTSLHRAQPLPDKWLVGTYTAKAACELIEDDLVERLREIRPAKGAA